MESMQWKHKTSPTPKKFTVEKFAGKVMATVFWDEKGLLLLEFMPQKTTITGQTYAIQLPLCETPSKRKGEESSQQACCSFMTTRQCTCLQNLKLPFGNVGSNS